MNKYPLLETPLNIKRAFLKNSFLEEYCSKSLKIRALSRGNWRLGAARWQFAVMSTPKLGTLAKDFHLGLTADLCFLDLL